MISASLKVRSLSPPMSTLGHFLVPELRLHHVGLDGDDNYFEHFLIHIETRRIIKTTNSQEAQNITASVVAEHMVSEDSHPGGPILYSESPLSSCVTPFP